MCRRLATFLTALAAVLAAQDPKQERPMRDPVRGLECAIAAGSEPSADAGLRAFAVGGNAVDAGVAAMFAAAVVEYSHFGFGGEAPILIRARDGMVHAIAGVGPMPRSATAQFFRDRAPRPGEVLSLEPVGLKHMVPAAGLLPALVPGMVDAALLSLREFGTLPLSEVIAPAIRLADGAPVDETRARYIRFTRRHIQRWPTSARVFLPGGKEPQPGDILRQDDLARTLRSMAQAEREALARGQSREQAIDAVRDLFYRGDIARRIDAFSRENGGLLRYADLAAFRLEVEPAETVTYRGFAVHKTGFWTQGPVMLQTLKLLEGFDLQAIKHNSEGYVHTVVEALKLAFADRDTFYGDPKVTPVPTGTLLSNEYADRRRALVTRQASRDFQPGDIEGRPFLHPSAYGVVEYKRDENPSGRDTTCINAVDREGMMFSATPSGAWLPSVIAGDTGIPLTQRAQSFLLVPGHPNELAGGKRPRVTLSPTLVTHDGRPLAALSSPGGDNQDQALLQVLLNVLEFGMNAQQALEAPRFQTRHLVSSFDNHAIRPADLLLDQRIPEAVIEALAARGHRVGTRAPRASGAAPVLILIKPNGVLEAGADPYGRRVAWAR
jgi:gamma-glutamyltranspeptidase/glutathione hydrolase